MSDRYAAALGLSRLLLQLGRLLNLLTFILLIACFVASFLFEPTIRGFFTKQPATIDPGLLMPILRSWMVLTVPVVVAVHILLSRLLEMIETVRTGDPFVPDNAVRMKTIAWCLLATQLYHLLCGVMAKAMTLAGSDIPWSFSASGWLAVLLLFVLAGVFEQGTKIRADLEAMI